MARDMPSFVRDLVKWNADLYSISVHFLIFVLSGRNSLKKGVCLWKGKKKRKLANRVKRKTAVFRTAPLPWSGLNMPGLMEKMSLVMMEEPDTFVEAGKGKSPVPSKTGL
jgi:hypothetical protein